MKLLFIAHFFPPSIGGMQTSNYLIIEGFMKMKMDFKLLIINDNQHHKFPFKYEKLNYNLVNLVDNFICAIKIKDYISSVNPDLVITLDAAIERAIGFSIFPLYKQFKILSINSGSLLLREHYSIKNYISLLAYMRAERIIDVSCVSEDTYKKLLKKYPKKKYKFFPLGRPISDSFFNKKIKANNVTKKYSNENLKLLSCGRAIHEKGVSLIIKALAEIKKELKKEVIELTFVGDGEEAKKWKKLSENLKLKKVFFHGSVPFDEIEEFYVKCDFFISPSFYKQESFGRVWVEAMAKYKPVIGTNHENLKYLIKDQVNGFVVLPEVQSIKGAILKALYLSNDKYKFLCENAFRYSSNYKQSNIVKSIIKLIENLLEKKN